MTTREALEATLAESPDDLVLNSAYADFLMDQGDARGEFIRLHLLAEQVADPSGQVANHSEQYALLAKAHELRTQHEQDWLGDLAPLDDNLTISWSRGWINANSITQASPQLIQALARHPLTRLLRQLSVAHNVTDEGYVSLDSLFEAGRFRHLKEILAQGNALGN